MFETLVASTIPAPPNPTRFLGSLGLHVVGFAGALVLTRHAPVRVRPLVDELPLVLLVPKVETRAPRTVPPRGSAAPTIPPLPVDVPKLNPLELPLIRPEIAAGSSGPLPSLLPSLITPGDRRSASEAGTDAALPVGTADQGVEVIEQARARYPDALQRPGITGSVELEYVVDTLGRPEPKSFRIIEAGHPAFVDAARTAVTESRYRAARVGGRPVRQLVRQRISFRVGAR